MFGVVNAENRDYLRSKPVLEKVGEKMPELATYPHLKYPNGCHEDLLKFYPDGKVRIFGYGSLMNKESAAKNMKPEAVASMQPVVAFGVKRIFNYQATKTDHWGPGQDRKEKAMLNLFPSFNIGSIANGVTIEVDAEDLSSLVKRERGYDLVPIIVGNWNDIKDQNPEMEMQIAYTFVVASELRKNIAYSSTEFYPVRGYLHAIQDGAKSFGKEFREVWNATTYLADGTTTIDNWDEETFRGILCTKDP